MRVTCLTRATVFGFLPPPLHFWARCPAAAAQLHRLGPPEVMTGVTDRAAAPDRKIIYIVNTHGWHVMKIMPKRQDPGSAFTIGLSGMFETVALS